MSALVGTFLRGAFQNIIDLIPKCEKIKKLAAICKLCKQTASFTYRIATAENQSLIGGLEAYMPVCRECHFVQSQLNKEAFRGDPTNIKANLEAIGGYIDK